MTIKIKLFSHLMERMKRNFLEIGKRLKEKIVSIVYLNFYPNVLFSSLYFDCNFILAVVFLFLINLKLYFKIIFILKLVK